MKLQVLYYKIITTLFLMVVMVSFYNVVWAQKNYNAIRINANGYLDFNGDSPVVRKIDYNFKNFIFDDEGCFAFGVHGLDIVDLDGNVILKGDNNLYCIYNLLIARSVEEIEQYYIGYVTNFKDGHFAFRIVCVEGNRLSGYKAEIIKDEEGDFARGLFMNFYVYDDTLYFMYYNERSKQLVLNKLFDKQLVPISYFDFPISEEYNQWDYSIAFSPDLSKLFISLRTELYVMDFDPVAGNLSNLKSINVEGLCHFAFSECGEYIYLLKKSDEGIDDYRMSILRCKLDSVSSNEFELVGRIDRRFTIVSDIILAPDGNLYVSEMNHKYLHLIKNTDADDCEFVENAIFLNGGKGGRSFPKTFIPSCNFSVSKQCNDVGMKYIGYPPQSVEWNLGDDCKSEFGTEVSHQYQSSGTYTISMMVQLKGGIRKTINKKVSVRILEKPIIKWK